MKAPLPANESERLESLHRYSILDTLPEREFDDLASLVASICRTPMAMVTLVDADRQWFKAKVGWDATETSRDIAFCAHAILQPDVLIVPDASADARFSTNPLVTSPPHIRFYAGAPLITPDGYALGTLCVFDSVPHELTADQASALRALSRQVVDQLELRRKRTDLQSALQTSEERWRAVFDKSAIGVALTDEKGRFVAVNRAYETMLGYSEEELRKVSFLDVTPEESRQPNRSLASEMWAGNRQQYQLEKPYRRKDGSLIWVRLHASLVSGAGNVPRLGLALCEDITERKLAEEALRKSESRGRTLLEINNALITNLSEGALLGAIAEAVRRIVPFDRAALTLYLPGKEAFRYLAVESGLDSEYFRAGMEFDRKASVSAWVFDHQQPAVRRDLEMEQRYGNDKRLVAEGLKSDCVVPLIVRGKSIGTLNVGSVAKDQYSKEDAEFLQEIANQVALAFENMRAYEQIAALKAKLEKENIYLREELRTEHNFEEIVGNSPTLLAVLHAVEQVAATDSSVLIYGETGTGKELIARAIHNRSLRRDRALVSVNCSAISAGLVESELFGHTRGAFTGAVERRVGRFELADGGTIFLDEVGELSLETQAKLLRVLQEHEFEPVGSSRSLHADVRVIAATNRNLREAVQAGQFRSDLFYRLSVFPLELPPLRERRSDIPQLVAFFVSRFAKRLNKDVEGVSQESMDNLINYQWPGNIRELQNVIERAVVISTNPILHLEENLVPVAASVGGLVTQKTVAQEIQTTESESSHFPTLEELERSHILAALQQTHGVVDGPKGAAKMLNLHPNTLRHRMDKLGIKRSRHRLS
jgi:formate hydrogenlyase transcriptional activator